MRTFIKTVETGSFAAAGEALDLSPQLVGKQVGTLEQHLGIRLLNRTTRKHSLTEFGEAYLERARAILEEVEDAERLAESARGQPVGRLKINAPVSFGTHTLAPLLVKFMQENPQVTVDLNLSNNLVNMVEDGYDIVFRVGELEDSGLIRHRLGPYSLILCASPSYLNSHQKINHPHDLASHECLGFAHSALRTRWSFMDSNKVLITIPVTSKFMVNQSAPLLTAALAGLGLILQPLELVKNALREGTLSEVLPKFPSPSPPLNILYPRDRRMTPKLKTFLKFCSSALNEEILTKR